MNKLSINNYLNNPYIWKCFYSLHSGISSLFRNKDNNDGALYRPFVSYRTRFSQVRESTEGIQSESREKTQQIRDNLSQQSEHKKVPKTGTAGTRCPEG